MFQSFAALFHSAKVPEPAAPLRRRTSAIAIALAPVYWIALAIMRTALHTLHIAHVVERMLMALGLIASLSGLLSLISFGMGWIAMTDFFWLWLGLGAGSCPLSPLIDRSLRPLFWMR